MLVLNQSINFFSQENVWRKIVTRYFLMEVSDFDYNLPEELIAQTPPCTREDARLLVVHKQSKTWEHYPNFTKIQDFLRAGDVLVLNNTKVIYARLRGLRNTGGKVEALVLRSNGSIAEALIQTTRCPKEGETYAFGKYIATVVGHGAEGWNLDFGSVSVSSIMQNIGLPPLPPYIKRKYKEQNVQSNPQVIQDRDRYQTVYAQVNGSVAAPTAGLHFTPTLLNKLKQKGIEIVEVTLHVGTGTFLPIKTETIEKHIMHHETYEVSQEAANVINRALHEKRRVIATGTTSCRTLETTGKTGKIIPGMGETNLFIYPGYQYRIVQGLITNFHLPKSTLLLLVSAFAGQDLVKKVYADAIEKKYRFFSYGDAMFLE